MTLADRRRLLEEMDRLIAHLDPDDQWAHRHDLPLLLDEEVERRVIACRQGQFLSHREVFILSSETKPVVRPIAEVPAGSTPRRKAPKREPDKQEGLFQ